MSRVMGWVVASGAALVLALALLLWGVGPASECSAPHQIHWFGGLPVFALFISLGSYIAIRGSTAQRLLLFLVSAIIIAAYVQVLSFSLPMVIQTEIACATDGKR